MIWEIFHNLGRGCLKKVIKVIVVSKYVTMAYFEREREREREREALIQFNLCTGTLQNRGGSINILDVMIATYSIGNERLTVHFFFSLWWNGSWFLNPPVYSKWRGRGGQSEVTLLCSVSCAKMTRELAEVIWI